MERFQPIFKYYEFTDQTDKIIVELEPQDGSSWAFHYLILCEKNQETGEWALFQNEWVPLADINSAKDQKEVIKTACLQLVQRLNNMES